MIYHIWSEHSSHYITDVVLSHLLFKKLSQLKLIICFLQKLRSSLKSPLLDDSSDIYPPLQYNGDIITQSDVTEKYIYNNGNDTVQHNKFDNGDIANEKKLFNTHL